MKQNTRQILLVCTVAAVMFGGFAWLIPASKEPGVWWFRFGGILVLLLITAFYRWTSRREDLAPDFFSGLNNFFEKDGFAFVVGTEVSGNTCHLCVYFQNRYDRECEATVMVRTSERFLAPQRHLPDATVSLTCEPGAFGKAVSNWPLPIELQGKKVLVDVMANRKYRKGRGKLLRFRSGLMVGSAPRSAGSDMLKFLGVFAGIQGGRSARTQLVLPTGVESNLGIGPDSKTQTRWKLGEPVPPNAGALTPFVTPSGLTPKTHRASP
jgi:hypothetical protein